MGCIKERKRRRKKCFRPLSDCCQYSYKRVGWKSLPKRHSSWKDSFIACLGTQCWLLRFFLVASGQYALLSIPASRSLTFFLQGLSDLCTSHSISLFELVLLLPLHWFNFCTILKHTHTHLKIERGCKWKVLKLEENKGKKICDPSRQRFLRYDIKDMVKRERKVMP